MVLTNTLLVGGLGVDAQQNGFHKVLILLQVWGWAKEKVN
jgi:hypothetical protein